MTKTQIMERLKAETDLDLLKCFPTRYESLLPTAEKPLSAFKDGERVRLLVKVAEIKSNRGARVIRFKGPGIKTATIYSFIVFKQMFYLNKLAAGKTFLVVAGYALRQKIFQVKAIYDVASRFVKAGAKPVYHLPKDLAQATFSSTLERILASPYMSYVKDEVPPAIRAKYKLLPRATAFKYVHDFQDLTQLKAGIRNFKYEEGLAYCVRMLVHKRYLSLLKKNTNVAIDRPQLRAFVQRLPFTLTADQKQALGEVVADMDGEQVMYRLLQGDVSTGKTAVALVSLYANWLRGGQGVLFVPTTALARQHYDSALRLYGPNKPTVALLVSGLKAGEYRAVLAGLKSGEIDIVIATQAGISPEVVYHNLTLAIIDEQQNFGVKQRALMVDKGQGVDTLMMTATPIPRTLAMIKTADTTLSELHQFPNGRPRLVQTKVLKAGDALIKKAIAKALAAHRQVFVVAPRIDESLVEERPKQSAVEIYAQYVKDYGVAKVQLLHGRLKATEQAKIIADFENKSRPILITTSVIEVGIDIVDAGLMVIYSANFFGLSALHQLRGRIGRSGAFALALLIYDGTDEKADEKLSYLARESDGYAISEYDSRVRGVGSIAGFNQSGNSDLSIADFSQDQNMFECALKDAHEILADVARNPDYREYVAKVVAETPLKGALSV